MTAATSDRIEKKILLKAPRTRVWTALTDAREFGRWFGVRLEGPFVAGQPLRGVMVGTEVDPDVAKAQAPYAGMPFDITVDRIEPERLFSFRWHPYAMEPGVDYSQEPTTLIVFTLEEAPGGILLTVSESGFEQIPLDRRAKAFAANEGGWTLVVTLVEQYLAQTA